LSIEGKTDRGIHYRVSGRNHAPALVLLHPLGASSGTWQPQLAEFERFFRVVLVDLRGHGGSQLKEGAPRACTVQDLADDALGVLNTLGIDRAHWCGLSIGGLIALQVAVMAPRRVLRLVLANTAAVFSPSSMWDERIETARTQGLAPLLAAIPERWFSAGFREREPEVVERIKRLLADTQVQGYIEACSALREVDLRARLSDVQAPTLVISSAQDLSPSIERAEELTEGVSGADLLVLDAAHLSNVEQSTEFTTAVVDFLRD